MSIKTISHERSLVLLKPDTVQRGLMGEILTRFERKGLKITAMKMVWVDEKQAFEHYKWSDEEKTLTGNRTIKIYKDKGLEIGDNPIKIAEDVQKRLVRHLSTGPVVAMVIEGAHAIDHIRKMVGHGSPLQADIGSIRADYTTDSYLLADDVNRASRNLVHASSNVGEAERELKVWFNEKEIFDYETAIEKILYSMDWEEKA